MTLAQYPDGGWHVMTAPGGQDMTRHASSARARRATEPDLRLLLDSAAEGFCSIDKDGVVTFCNTGFLRMTGFERHEEAIGQDFHRLIHHSRADGSPYPR